MKLLIVTSMVRTHFKIGSVRVKVANNLKVVLTPIKLDLVTFLPAFHAVEKSSAHPIN